MLLRSVPRELGISPPGFHMCSIKEGGKGGEKGVQRRMQMSRLTIWAGAPSSAPPQPSFKGLHPICICSLSSIHWQCHCKKTPVCVSLLLVTWLVNWHYCRGRKTKWKYWQVDDNNDERGDVEEDDEGKHQWQHWQVDDGDGDAGEAQWQYWQVVSGSKFFRCQPTSRAWTRPKTLGGRKGSPRGLAHISLFEQFVLSSLSLLSSAKKSLMGSSTSGCLNNSS